MFAESGEVRVVEATTLQFGQRLFGVNGAAVANAIYDSVGARVLRMPMTPERVTAAMAKE